MKILMENYYCPFSGKCLENKRPKMLLVTYKPNLAMHLH